MKKSYNISLIILLILSLAITACSSQTGNQNSGSSNSGSTDAFSGTSDSTLSDSGSSGTDGNSAEEGISTRTESDFTDMFTNRDYEVGYDETESTTILLKNDTAECNSDSVQISENTVTITDEGTYILSGNLDNGMLLINAGENDKLHLIFNGVSINNDTSAAICILEADKVFITLESNTDNRLSNGGTFTPIDDNNIDGCIFSKQDLTFNGSGSLSVTSPSGHGIVCKDDLVFTSGTFTVSSASRGLDANDSIRIANTAFTIDAGKDGIHAENSDDANLGFIYIESGSFDISAEGDGLSAGSDIMIKDGTFSILSGGGNENAEKKSSDSWGSFKGGRRSPSSGSSPDDRPDSSTNEIPGNSPGNFPDNNSGIIGTSTVNEPADTDNSGNTDDSTSMKGIKTAGNLIIKGGTFTIDSADDSVHSNSSITIEGGIFDLASGDDGFHADESLSVSSGTILITDCYEGLEGLNVNISGGTINLTAEDDGLNAAGGNDQSGFGGPRKNDRFGGGSFVNGSPESSSSAAGNIIISGGCLNITASGDGLDSNGSLIISGGETIVCGPTTGDTSILDYEISGTITGGTFIGTGSSHMFQSFSDFQQSIITAGISSQSDKTGLTLSDKKGNSIINVSPALPYEAVVISCPELKKGETYILTAGNNTYEVQAE